MPPDASEKLFARLLAKLDRNRLPDLIPRPSWYETYVEPWLKLLRDWLAQWMPKGQVNPDLRELITLALALLPYLLAALALVLVLVLLFLAVRRAWLAMSRVETEETGAAPAPLETLVSDALRARDYARAARLRWKLFLARRREPESRTPLEMLPGERAFVLRQYALMFGHVPDPEPTYGALHEWLSQREHGKRELGREGATS